MKDLTRLEGIVERACIITNTTLFELLYGGQHRAIVDVRRRVAKEAREAGYSLPEIGRALQRHHTTVMNLLKVQAKQKARAA